MTDDAKSMAITVEFYGVPRARCGVDETTVFGRTLGDVLRALAELYPEFARDCLETSLDDSVKLKQIFAANTSGDRFISDPKTNLDHRERLLILSADVGG